MTEERKAAHAYPLDNTDPSLAPRLFSTLQEMQQTRPVAWSDAVGDGFWALTKYEDITQAAKDWETYTVEEGHTIPSTGKSVMLALAEIDPPIHTSWRKYLKSYFTAKQVEEWRPEIERIVEEAFADVVATGKGDLVRDVAGRIPTSVISAMLGFKQQWKYISALTEEWMASASDTAHPERAKEAAAALEAEVRHELSLRIGKPVKDILGEIVNGEIDGKPIPYDELVGLTIVFIVAGHNTTVDGIVNTIHRILVEPGLFDRLKKDRSILPGVIDESLRISPPVWNMGRTARKEVEVRGVAVHPGEKVMLTFGAGNYDPEHFENPEAFDFQRTGVHGHLTFGYGRHRCIGEALAKLEMSVVIEYVLDHLPDLALDGEPEPRTTFTTYGLHALPVRRSSLVSG